jgi:hypothetical protein
MKTLYFFFRFQTVKPEKYDAMIKTDFAPKMQSAETHCEKGL